MAVQRQNRRGRKKTLLEKYVTGVEAKSRADGNFELAVKYKTRLPPGVMTRMLLADEIDKLLQEQLERYS